jgi:hypothetical protein
MNLHATRSTIVAGMLATMVLSGCGATQRLTAPATAGSSQIEPIDVGFAGEWVNADGGAALSHIDITSSASAMRVHAYGAAEWGTASATPDRDGLVALFDAVDGPHRLSIAMNNAAGTELKVVDVSPQHGVTTYVFESQASPLDGLWVNDDPSAPFTELIVAVRGTAATVHAAGVRDWGVAEAILDGGQAVVLFEDGSVTHRLSLAMPGATMQVTDVVAQRGVSHWTFHRTLTN